MWSKGQRGTVWIWVSGECAGAGTHMWPAPWAVYLLWFPEPNISVFRLSIDFLLQIRTVKIFLCRWGSLSQNKFPFHLISWHSMYESNAACKSLKTCCASPPLGEWSRWRRTARSPAWVLPASQRSETANLAQETRQRSSIVTPSSTNSSPLVAPITAQIGGKVPTMSSWPLPLSPASHSKI